MSDLIVSCHQPNFIPYLGFFDKMDKSDIFVIRDEVLFTDSDYHHRNRIRINSNDNLNNPMFKWLTVPVVKVNDYILHVKIKRDAKIKNKHWKEVMLHDITANYKNTPYFDDFFPIISQLFENEDESLINLNMRIIDKLKKLFEIDTKIVFASDLGLKPLHYTKSDATVDLINICKNLNADIYLSGSGGKEYLDINKFDNSLIKAKFQDFHHPVYKQNFPGFLSNMSALDALFCIGNKIFSQNKLLIQN